MLVFAAICLACFGCGCVPFALTTCRQRHKYRSVADSQHTANAIYTRLFHSNYRHFKTSDVETKNPPNQSQQMTRNSSEFVRLARYNEAGETYFGRKMTFSSRWIGSIAGLGTCKYCAHREESCCLTRKTSVRVATTLCKQPKRLRNGVRAYVGCRCQL